ncbi:MAG TPA: hypothetical protein VMM84_09115 [Pyrinomonadaceae bacterium]|nr:hypothetical protein [Pyrinomonadaceae bacterium]
MAKKSKALHVKRMKRAARLKYAPSWLKSYSGSVPAGYREHFGVDWVCAFKELEILGVRVDPEYRDTVLKSVARDVEARTLRKLRRKEALDGFVDSDDTFAYIAGYTAAGFPYGVTWEEWEQTNQMESLNSQDSVGDNIADFDYDPCEEEFDDLDSLNPQINTDMVGDGDSEDIPF